MEIRHSVVAGALLMTLLSTSIAAVSGQTTFATLTGIVTGECRCVERLHRLKTEKKGWFAARRLRQCAAGPRSSQIVNGSPNW